MNNILIPFPDKNNFKFFMENNIDGFIIGIEGYSETFNHLVKMSELNDICKMLKEKDKKIYIMLNKVYFNKQMDELKKVVRSIEKLDINALIFSDMSVLNIVRELGGDPVGVGCIVDRSAGNVDFGVPLISVLSMEIKSYEAQECPLCKEGKIPAIKPGSSGKK